MAKIIRPTYPAAFSVGLLILIFAVAFFLSPQIFNVSWRELMEGTHVYFGMFLVSLAVLVMVLVLWEEFLFPIKLKPMSDIVEFRNHRNKLKTQLLIYLIIPVIFIFIYMRYEVNHVRFFIWAAICIIIPVAGKLFSGINNYNDFLKLTNDTIEFRNNEKIGNFNLEHVSHLELVRDERNVLHKIEVQTDDGKSTLIDLDEMELEAFLVAIDKFIVSHYKKQLDSKGINFEDNL